MNLTKINLTEGGFEQGLHLIITSKYQKLQIYVNKVIIACTLIIYQLTIEEISESEQVIFLENFIILWFSKEHHEILDHDNKKD